MAWVAKQPVLSEAGGLLIGRLPGSLIKSSCHERLLIVVLSEEKCQLLAPPKQAARGTETLQVPHTITTISTGQVILLHTAINVQKHFLHLSRVFLAFSYQNTSLMTLFPSFLVLQMECLEGARSWPAQTCTHTIFLPLLCNASGSSYRNWRTEVHTARLPVRLCPSFLLSSLYQSCPGLTANACQLPLCEASQISQAVSLASRAHRR